MEGVIKYLISDNTIVRRLRDLYIFKIIPMLNPEGVIVGNFRCSLIGIDLNRRWDTPDEILHSQILYLKGYMKMLIEGGREILMFCDLHGHAMKNNSFVYGCNKAADGGFCSWTKVRLLPRIIATKTPMFSYNDCGFRVKPFKEGTARVVVWKEFKVTNSFTFESSFFGYVRGNEVKAYEVEDYYELGRVLLNSLAEYHYVLKNLEKELITTKGWLKPIMLVQVTGPLAAEELAKRLAKDEREKRVEQRKAKDSNKVLNSR